MSLGILDCFKKDAVLVVLLFVPFFPFKQKMQYNELHGFNFILMLICCHELSMQSICYSASKTWDLCSANGVKKLEHGIVRRNQAHFLAREGALIFGLFKSC